ncbi:hypothetical protein D1BOALGB6SA_6542 [Olavius sp. associated proteobacterium Delta 1]|nr:hypothetical protein D1BOALGB6SA_6542 [Olavius sp. associated proteobacterium Delta 1]
MANEMMENMKFSTLMVQTEYPGYIFTCNPEFELLLCIINI